MKPLELSIGEPFTSPAWGSNFVVFSNETGLFVAESEARAYIARCTAYARQYQVYLVPERFVAGEYHSLCLIGPDGRVLGAQQGLYRSSRYPHLKQGTQMNGIQTEFGTLYLCVDVDIYYPEVAKLASNSGADILICSQGIAGEDFSNHAIIAGVWGAAQANHLYAVGACNQFNCVAAPRIIKQYEQGFVVSPSRKMPVTATLNAQVLEHLPAKARMSRRLYLAHQKELLQG